MSRADLYSPAHGWIWEAITAVVAKSQAVDVTMVAQWLKDQSRLAEVGGTSALVGLFAGTPVVDVEPAAKKIRDLAQARRMIATCQRIAAEGYEARENIQEWLDNSASAVSKAAECAASEDVKPMREYMLSAFNKFHEAKAAHAAGGIVGLSTGYTRLDRSLNGLSEGNLYILAARPGMGKTTVAASIAINAVLCRGPSQPGALIFELEMPGDQIAMRAAAAEARIPLAQLYSGEPVDEMTLSERANQICSPYLFMRDKPGITLAELRASIRKLRVQLEGQTDENGRPVALRLVMIDYLQQIQNRIKNGTREQEVSEITRTLKEIAKTEQVAIVALSQLNRGVESRQDRRPQLSDLKESGAIEADADCVMFLYRDEYYNPDTEDKNILEVIIAKQRNGPTGTVHLYFDGQCTRVDNLDESYQPRKKDEYQPPHRKSRWEGKKAAQ
jgi:replicative DNA helicase